MNPSRKKSPQPPPPQKKKPILLKLGIILLNQAQISQQKCYKQEHPNETQKPDSTKTHKKSSIPPTQSTYTDISRSIILPNFGQQNPRSTQSKQKHQPHKTCPRHRQIICKLHNSTSTRNTHSSKPLRENSKFEHTHKNTIINQHS